MFYLSGYRLMWMLVMFDLPVITKKQIKDATRFRNFLLDKGFSMAQFSVYLKNCTGKEHTERLTNQIKANIPEYGKIDIIYFTDKQYENIVTFHGRKKKNRSNPEQFLLFQPDIEKFLID